MSKLPWEKDRAYKAADAGVKAAAALMREAQEVRDAAIAEAEAIYGVVLEAQREPFRSAQRTCANIRESHLAKLPAVIIKRGGWSTGTVVGRPLRTTKTQAVVWAFNQECRYRLKDGREVGRSHVADSLDLSTLPEEVARD